jgi:hypothetical protein
VVLASAELGASASRPATAVVVTSTLTRISCRLLDPSVLFDVPVVPAFSEGQAATRVPMAANLVAAR